MEAPFPGGLVSLDVSESGRLAVLDSDGRRLGLGGEVVELEFAASRCRFHGENLVLLGSGRLRSLRPDGSMIGEMHVPAEAADLAVLPSGSVLVGVGRTLHRISEPPVAHEEKGLERIRAIAAESGGVWVAGETARAIRLRPVAAGYEVAGFFDLPGPPRAAAVGPDGDLYTVLEPGDRLMRGKEAVVRLPTEVADLVRHESRLWGCGPKGLFDLTGHVPKPAEKGPRFDLP